MNMVKKIAAILSAVCIVGVSVAAASLTVPAEGKSDPPYTAFIAASVGANQQWKNGDWEGNPATIETDGQYTISAIIPEDGGAETIEFLAIETDINVYAFVAEGGDYKTEGTLKLAVDRIWVSHLDGSETDLTYTGPGANAYCTRDDGSSARLNILNEWGGPVQQTNDIDKNIPGGIKAGESINIQFTVSGITAGGGDTGYGVGGGTTFAPSPIHEIQWKDWWYHIIDDSSIEITGYTGDENVIEIPSKIDGYTVKGIGDSAFFEYGYESYFDPKKIIIPDSASYIGDYAFSRCRLNEITIPDSITQIGEAAFFECRYLTSISIQGEISEIKDNTFSNCLRLESVSLPDSVLQISNNAFTKCESLSSINLPSELKTIGDYAFSGCTKLNAVDIPSSTTYLGNYAFYNCTELVSINLSDNLNQIGEAAFLNCESILAISLPNGITELEGDIFYNCVNLQAIYIPNSILNICDSAFRYCDALNDVYYGGTENMWDAITIETNNRCLLNATIHYNCQEIETTNITTTITTTIVTNLTNIVTTSTRSTTTSTTSTTSTNPGDLDGDTTITMQDAYQALMASSRVSAGQAHGLTDAQFAAADVDGDGKLTMTDAYWILMYVSYRSAGNEKTWEELIA